MATKSKTRDRWARKAELTEELGMVWETSSDLKRIFSLPNYCWCGYQGRHGSVIGDSSSPDGNGIGGCRTYQPVLELSPRKLWLWVAACYCEAMEGGSTSYCREDIPVPWTSCLFGDLDEDEEEVEADLYPILPETMAGYWANPDQDNPMDPSTELRILLLRDVFGNPFVPLTDLDWSPLYRTREVVGVARELWDGAGKVCGECEGMGLLVRNNGDAFECPSCRGAKRVGQRLDGEGFPILADALEDAGCTDSRILSHLRSPFERACRGTLPAKEKGVKGEFRVKEGGAPKACDGREVWSKDSRRGAVREGIWTCRKCGRVEASEGPAHIRGNWVIDLCLELE